MEQKRRFRVEGEEGVAPGQQRHAEAGHRAGAWAAPSPLAVRSVRVHHWQFRQRRDRTAPAHNTARQIAEFSRGQTLAAGRRPVPKPLPPRPLSVML